MLFGLEPRIFIFGMLELFSKTQREITKLFFPYWKLKLISISSPSEAEVLGVLA